MAHGTEPVCPFCYGHEELTPPEISRIGKGKPNSPGWDVRVIPNKFPITKIHEIIIHSPDHRKNFSDLSQDQMRKILQAYRERFLTHKESGQVFIFNNHGKKGAESLPHPHTQVAVLPFDVGLSCGRLGDPSNVALETDRFLVFCPQTSEWPYETWIAPKRRGFQFGEISNDEINEFSYVMPEILRRLGSKLDGEFSYNFFIYPGGDWYWRLIPRMVVRGGFEWGTGVMVNIVDPKDAVKLLQSK